MTWRLGIGWVTTCALATIGAPAHGLEVARTASVGDAPPIAVAVGARVMLRLVGQKSPGADWARAFELQRAQLGLDVRWGSFLRLQVEPDFGGTSVSLRDAFLEIEPLRELDVRVGRTKSPHGVLDTMSRWDLPSLSRGLWNDVLVDRLGFGDRQLSVLTRLRLRELPLRPWVVAGVMGDPSTDAGLDAAAALGVRLMKGLDVQASWHHRAGATTDGDHGNAWALGATYDRKRIFALLEGSLGHARLIRRDGLAPDRDAAFLAARSRFALRLPLDDAFSLEPVLGAELLDPELSAGGDLGVEILGTVNLRWLDALRFSVEVSAQLGQDAFVVADRVQLTAMVGANL